MLFDLFENLPDSRRIGGVRSRFQVLATLVGFSNAVASRFVDLPQAASGELQVANSGQ